MMTTLFLTAWRLAGLIAWPLLLLNPAARRHMIGLPRPTPGRTWVHGASLGEHRAVAALRDKVGPDWITSSSWRTPVACAFPAPLDLPFVIGPWLDRARPGRVILVEGELWPGWLDACKRRGIPVTVISARQGTGWRRWQWVQPLFRQLVSGVQFLDSAEYGDLKALSRPTLPSLELPDKVIIGASTRAGDEALLVNAWRKLPSPRPLLVLAPRQPDRVPQVLTCTEPFKTQLRSQLGILDAEILILDTLGELAGLIGGAHVVLVGGTFDHAIGGHSPLEAATAGAHIIAGPERTAHAAVWDRLRFTPVVTAADIHAALTHTLAQPRPTPQQPACDLDGMLAQLPEPVILEERPHRPMLWCLTPIWRLLTALVRSRHRAQRLPRPTVVVGGLVTGGAGRTPVAGWLADNLQDCVVLSAGYRREGSGRDIRTSSSNMSLGDELEMLSRRGHHVISAPDRVRGMDAALPDATVIIDGGFSDRRLDNAFKIAVIDTQRPHGGGPIPVGSQRLPWSELEKANAIWLSNCRQGDPLPPLPDGIPIVRSQFVPESWLHKGKHLPIEAHLGDVDVAVGVAIPERFICSLLDLGMRIQSLQIVRDHGDLGDLTPGTVITEKDAARLPEDADTWALRMTLKTEGEQALLEAIRRHVQ